LTKLLDDPKQGASALRERLAQVDRETLVKLLCAKTSALSKLISSSIRYSEGIIVGSAPTLGATKQVVDFEANLESYLRTRTKKNSTGSDPRSAITSMIHRVEYRRSPQAV